MKIRHTLTKDQVKRLHKRLDDVLDSERGSIILVEYDEKPKITDLHLGYTGSAFSVAMANVIMASKDYMKQISTLWDKAEKYDLDNEEKFGTDDFAEEVDDEEL